MSEPIGASGFEAVVTSFSAGRHGGSGTKVTIKNIKTGESIGDVLGRRSCPHYGECYAYKTGNKTFYGLDDRYYHVMTTWNSAKWGQVQSTGAVIDSKRSVITVLDFYPIYIQKPEPVLTPIPAPVQVVTPITPPVRAVTPAPKVKSVTYMPEDDVPKVDSWLEKLINWIKKMFNLK